MQAKLKIFLWFVAVSLVATSEDHAAAQSTPSLQAGQVGLVRDCSFAPATTEAVATSATIREQIFCDDLAPGLVAGATERATIQSLWATARLANSRFAFAEAETALRKALDLQFRLFGEDDDSSAALLLDLAMVAANQQRFAEAEDLLRRAGPVVERSPRARGRARLAGYQANIKALKGDFPTALAAARSASEQWRAIASAQVSDLNPLGEPLALGELAMALNREAQILLRLEDPLSANAHASEALVLILRAPGAPLWWRSDILATLATTSIALGRLSAAETYFKAAIDLRRKVFGEGVATLKLQIGLARAYQAEGLNTSAIIAFRQAIAAARQLPRDSTPFSAEDLVPFAAAAVDLGETLTSPADLQGLLGEVFDAFQMAAAPDRDRTLVQSAERLAASVPELASLLQDIADTRSASAQTRAALAVAQSRPADEQEPALQAELLRKLSEADRRLSGLSDDLAVRYPDYARLSAASLPRLDTVRARLSGNEAIAMFLIGKNTSFVQLIRRSGLSMARIDAGEADIRRSVGALRRGLEIEGGALNPFDLELSAALHDQLLGPVRTEISDLTRLVVIAPGPLANLPFSVLVTKAGSRDDYAGSRWLLENLAITHSPSLESFLALRSTRLSGGHKRLMLAVADPVLQGRRTDQRAFAGVSSDCRPGSSLDPAIIGAMAQLPETRSEVLTIQTLLGGVDSTVLVGGEATEPRLREETLSEYRILYFATHAVVPGELQCQVEPGLVLSPPQERGLSRERDGMLDASEIARLRLRAELVVLSACNSAGSDPGSGQGGGAVSGLALAFFHAGARNLLASHWQVPSAATARLMVRTFEAMRNDPANTGSVDQALRVAQLASLRDRARAHPFFWGAFVVLGDGASAPLHDGAAS